MPLWQELPLLLVIAFCLAVLIRTTFRTLKQIRTTYDALPPEHLARSARAYGARYVLATRRLPAGAGRLVFTDTTGRYFLYDLRQQGVPRS